MLLACATLGLAPFAPQPHVLLHGTPWLLPVAKLALAARGRPLR